MSTYPMKIKRDHGAFNIVGADRGEIIVRGLATELAALNWIDENAGDWPPNWEFAQRRKRARR